MADKLPAAGTVLGGKYVLGAPIGTGGAGTVFEASAGGAAFALKVLVEDDAELRARFAREITVSAGIVHPNVLPIIDHGMDPLPYLVMPRMKRDLGKALEETKIFAPEVAAAVAVGACRGVGAGHAAGVVHRDLKPANILLDERDVVMVGDFGLAKIHGTGIDSLTSSGALLGTPHYMSPEQAENAKRVDVRTDVFSLGMVLYHMLTGSPAFARPGTFMAFLVGQATIKPLQDKAPWVAPELARVVHAALLRAPEARWPSVAELELGIAMAAGFAIANGPTPSIHGPSAEARAIVEPRADLPTHWEDLLRR